MGRQWRRALALLRGAGLVEADVRGRYLAARCLMEVIVHRQICRLSLDLCNEQLICCETSQQ